MKTLKTKKVALSVLALGAASAAVVFGSFASWTAQTTNPGNTITAGKLTMSNSKSGLPILTTGVTNAKPGSGNTDNVTITNTGSYAATVKLTQSAVADALSDSHNVMKFTIYDSTKGACIYPAGAGACPALTSALTGAAWNGATTIASLPIAGTGGSTWAAGEAHSFDVTWKYTDDGTVDNTNNNATVKTAAFDLTWDAA
jgi:predicted ribosomally synthesized peptide with SipW-like signal peptide